MKKWARVLRYDYKMPFQGFVIQRGCLTPRPEFQNYPNRVRFSNEQLFRKTEIVENGRVVLAECHIYSVQSRKFRNRSSKECGIAGGADSPESISPATVIQTSLQRLQDGIFIKKLAHIT